MHNDSEIMRGRAKYPWRTMKAGDEFIAEGVVPTSFRTVAYAAAKRVGIRVETMAVSDTSVRVLCLAAGGVEISPERLKEAHRSGLGLMRGDILYMLPDDLRAAVTTAAGAAGRKPSEFAIEMLWKGLAEHAKAGGGGAIVWSSADDSDGDGDDFDWPDGEDDA